MIRGKGAADAGFGGKNCLPWGPRRITGDEDDVFLLPSAANDEVPMKKKPNKPSAVGVTRRRRWKALFLNHFARMGNVTLAAEAAGVGRMTVYEHKAADRAFAAKWDEAMQDAADTLEAEARRRAVEGVQKYITHKTELVTVPVDKDGKVVAPGDPTYVASVPLVEKLYSDNLLLAMLRAKKPNEYRDNISLTSSSTPVVDDEIVLVHTAPPAKE